MSQRTDEDLMASFCAGDEAAFDELFSRHAGPVHGFLLRMVRDSAQAEDLVQQTFLSLIRSRGRYEQGQPVGPWLLTIAANAARDLLRRRVRSVEDLARDDGPPAEVGVMPEVSDPGARKQIEAAFAALPDQQREAVILHKLQGWSFEQIAEALEISVTAARIRAHRGYAKLRESLAGLEAA